jgi:hypothetical protein
MKTVLLIHRGALGDFVLTLPVLRALHEAGYGRRILVTYSGHARLAKALGVCEEMVDCECGLAHRFLSQQTDSIPDVKAALGRIDLIIALLSDPGNTFAAWIQEQWNAPSYVLFPRPPESLRIHVHDYLFGALHPLGLDPSLPHQDFWKGGPLRLIHPGSGSESKNFNDTFYLKLRNLLAPAEFLLGPVEMENGKKWPGSPLIPSRITDLAEILIYAGTVISNDSGVAHLSAFLGIPTLALFKTTDPAIWQPRGLRVRVLNKPELSVQDAVPLLNELFSCHPARSTGSIQKGCDKT